MSGPIALLPCPFCGGEPETYTGADGMAVFCPSCMTSTDPMEGEAAVDLWNDRLPTAAAGNLEANKLVWEPRACAARAAAFGVDSFYYVTPSGGSWSLLFPSRTGVVEAPGYTSMDAAKAAAQVDYERRVLAATNWSEMSVKHAARVLLGDTTVAEKMQMNMAGVAAVFPDGGEIGDLFDFDMGRVAALRAIAGEEA